jgi:signal transduction histidine kinase
MEMELAKAQKLESIGILAGGIAHDFNNLLSVIVGHLSLTHTYVTDEKASESLIVAEKACQQAAQLARHLMPISPGWAFPKKSFSLKKLLESVVPADLGDSGIECRLRIPEDLRQIEGNIEQIGQLFKSLFINAAEAMPEGGIIEVNARNESAAVEGGLPEMSDALCITVTDCGTGIKAEHLCRIFDPYFSTKQRGTLKGMGLGLTLAYAIVTRHGGTIEVESQPDIGSSFHIRLPASRKSEQKRNPT